MTSQDIPMAIELLSKNLGIAANEIIKHYTRWFIAASIGYIVLAICIGLISIYISRKIDQAGENDQYDKIFYSMWSWIILLIGILIASWLFCAQIGDLIAPTGAAINQLLHDIL